MIKSQRAVFLCKSIRELHKLVDRKEDLSLQLSNIIPNELREQISLCPPSLWHLVDKEFQNELNDIFLLDILLKEGIEWFIWKWHILRVINKEEFDLSPKNIERALSLTREAQNAAERDIQIKTN